MSVDKRLFQIPDEFAEKENYTDRCNYLAFEKTDLETVKIIMNWVFGHLDRWIPAVNGQILNFLTQNNFFRSEFSYGISHRLGNCGVSTTVFNLFCHLSGIESRGLSIYSEVIPGSTPYGHTLCEAKINDSWYTFDPSVNVYFTESLETIARSPEKFYSSMDDRFIDKKVWREKRLWTMCNEKLYSNIIKIEYRKVAGDDRQFGYDDKITVVRLKDWPKPSLESVT